jgi:hypothetical protein
MPRLSPPPGGAEETGRAGGDIRRRRGKAGRVPDTVIIAGSVNLKFWTKTVIQF